MEAGKGVVFNRGRLPDGRFKTLIGMVIVSDKPIIGEGDNEFIVMGGTRDDTITNVINDYYTKYKAPYPMGTLNDAVVSVSSMTPKDLEEYPEIV